MATLAGPRHALVHGGAVGDRRGALLLAGPGGVGRRPWPWPRSRPALQLRGRRLSALGRRRAGDHLEPVCGRRRSSPRPSAEPVFPPAGRRAASPPLHLLLPTCCVLDVSGRRPAQIAQSLPLRAVLVPRVGPAGPRCRPLSKAQAMLALTPSTVFQMPYDDGAAIPIPSRTARKLPCFSPSISAGARPSSPAPRRGIG